MFNLIHYIVTHFSGFALGWHSKSLADLGNIPNSGGWEGFSIIIMIFIGIILVCNLANYVAIIVNELTSIQSLIFFIPSAIFYLIFNVIFHMFLVCLFITIGGLVGFCLIGVVYIILLAVFSAGQVNDNGYATGTFNLMRFITEYSDKLGNYFDNINIMKTKYNKFLNTQY